MIYDDKGLSGQFPQRGQQFDAADLARYILKCYFDITKEPKVQTKAKLQCLSCQQV